MSNLFEMYPEDAFRPRACGGMRLHGGKGGSSAPPPDPRLVEAQIKSMGFQDEAIKQIMSNSADMAPLQKEQLQFGLDSSRTAYAQSQQDRAFALGRRDQLQVLQDSQINDAKSFNTEAKANELAGLATADVNSGFDSAQAQSSRALSRMGVNPSSGQALAINNQNSVARAAGLAGAANSARTGARMEGRALTGQALNTLSGYPTMGTQTTAAGSGYGVQGLNAANVGLNGLNSGYKDAGSVAGAMGQNATSAFGAQGNYQRGAQANAQAESDSTMSTVGTVAGIAIAI